MNMIEVDPILFIKCRLCSGETGQYQIVPNVQMQIKYCFDIDVEPFDGLPQLVCRKCESILSQYTGIKQIFQEKQKILKSKLSSNVLDNIIEQQDNSTNFAQAVIENNPQRIKKYNRKETAISTRNSDIKADTFKTNRRNDSKTTWQSTYTKYFVCRFCTKSFKTKKGINKHIHKNCNLYTKYSNINKSICLVELNKIEANCNMTGSIDKVVYNKNKIIQSKKANYYIIYTKDSNNQNSLSDLDRKNIIDDKKRKRKCLIKRGSNKSVVIEQNTAKNSCNNKITKVRKHEKDNVFLEKHELHEKQIISDTKCVNIEDFDSKSTKLSVKTKDLCVEKPNTIYDKMISNIIARCSDKYMNRISLSKGGNIVKCQQEACHEHKLVNIVHSEEFSTIGLLKTIEQNNLEVVWLPKVDSNSKIKVLMKTRLKENKNSEDNSDLDWQNITSLQNYKYETEDFTLVFEKKSELEPRFNENSEDKQLIAVKPQYPKNVTEKEQKDFALVFEGISELEAYINKTNKDKQLIQVYPQFKENMTEKEQDNTSMTCFGNLNKYKMKKVEVCSNKDSVSGKALTNVDKFEKKVKDNITNSTKLLNASPVPNPKKIPKKNLNEPMSFFKIYSNESKNISEFNERHINIDKSTEQLVNVIKEQADVDCSNNNANEIIKDDTRKPQSTLPKIQCKPISELMSDTALTLQNNPFVANTNTNSIVNNENQNVMMQANDNNMVCIENSQFTNVNYFPQDPVYYPQRQNIETLRFNAIVNQPGSTLLQNRENFQLHFVGVPNTRTESTSTNPGTKNY